MLLKEMMQPMQQQPAALSSQLMTPVGGLATIGIAAAIGSYIFTTKKFNELSGHIEESNKQIAQLTQFVQKVDPKTITKLQHHMHELSHGISEMSTFVSGLASTVEAIKAEQIAMKADLQQLYESTGQTLELPIPQDTAPVAAAPVAAALRRRTVAAARIPQVVPLKPSAAPAALPTAAAQRSFVRPRAQVVELPPEGDDQSDDVDDIAARAAAVRS